ncbi:hypothetical protein B5S33_g3219 [[Candida] boidinii]|nr:hypothetical protein B5S30_g924 [[Candida] boidinii]OWB84570.1 hypothetical protein B5S33_g3219 [[Candida] boidinii]
MIEIKSLKLFGKHFIKTTKFQINQKIDTLFTFNHHHNQNQNQNQNRNQNQNQHSNFTTTDITANTDVSTPINNSNMNSSTIYATNSVINSASDTISPVKSVSINATIDTFNMNNSDIIKQSTNMSILNINGDAKRATKNSNNDSMKSDVTTGNTANANITQKHNNNNNNKKNNRRLSHIIEICETCVDEKYDDPRDMIYHSVQVSEKVNIKTVYLNEIYKGTTFELKMIYSNF